MLFLGVNNCLRSWKNSYKALGTETGFFTFGRNAPQKITFELIQEGRLGETKNNFWAACWCLMLFLGVNNCLRACLNSHKALRTETGFFTFGRNAPEGNFWADSGRPAGWNQKYFLAACWCLMLFFGVNNCPRSCLNSQKALGTETGFFTFGRNAPEGYFWADSGRPAGWNQKYFLSSLLMFNALLRCNQLPQILLE